MTDIKKSITTVTIFGWILTCASLGVANAASAAAATRGVGYSDPISGLHWQRIANPQHPSAPPRLALVESSDHVSVGSRESVVCIRAGDQILLQSDNRKAAEISLKATALASGVAGDRIRARVTVTGAIVEMIVRGPGAGTIVARMGVW